MIENFPKYYFKTPNYPIKDITGFFDNFIDDFFALISTMLNLLDSIHIYGIGLLDILITIFIISLIIPIILSLVRSRVVRANRERRKKKNKGKKGKH